VVAVAPDPSQHAPATRSKTTFETNRSEKPSFEANQVAPPSVLRTTPAPPSPAARRRRAGVSTSLMIRFFCVMRRQVAELSSLDQRPSVVPAKRRFWSSGLCANDRVRRLLEGMPLIFVHLPAPSSDR
jgi:hypothetical protein